MSIRARGRLAGAMILIALTISANAGPIDAAPTIRHLSPVVR